MPEQWGQKLVWVSLLAQVLKQAGSPDGGTSLLLPQPLNQPQIQILHSFGLCFLWIQLPTEWLLRVSVCQGASSWLSWPLELPTHRVNLIEDLPLLVGHPKRLSSLDGPLQLACPHLQVCYLLLLQKIPQSLSKLGLENKNYEKQAHTLCVTQASNVRCEQSW